MQYFTIQAKSEIEAVQKMKLQYGAGARILSRKDVRLGGVLGLFRQSGVELTGYISNNAMPVNPLKMEEEKQKILLNVKTDKTMQMILKEIQALKQNIKHPEAEPASTPIARIEELLRYNDFSEDYIKQIRAKIRASFSLEDLEKQRVLEKAVLGWIGDSIELFSADKKAALKPKVIIVVGPTGVGKTTTIAKLAAIYGLDEQAGLNVRMVTIDNYKIAAKKQIETYAEIMQLPLSVAESKEDLQKIINLYLDNSVILIDTIGKSPKDFEKLSEMQNLLSVCGHKSEIHLALSATTKVMDIEEILHQFEPFKYHGVIITKMDETTQVGSVISVLSKYNKKISYITDGQMVPQDIEAASVPRFLMTLSGFQLDREWIENKYKL